MAVEEIHIHPSRRKPLHSGGLTFRSVNDFDVTDRDMEKARKELKESDETRIDSLKKLKEMLEGDKGLLYRKDDNYLLRYLRYSKFDCKRAYNMMRKFYSFRINHPEFFELHSNFEYMLNANLIRHMPYRDADGSIVILADYRLWNLDKMSILDPLILFNAISDIVTMSPHSQIHGFVFILDLRGISTNHLWQIMSPKTLFLLATNVQSIYAYRIKRVIGLHCNASIRMCYSTGKYLLKKKVADRVILLGSDMAELHQYVNPALLPTDYGGTLGDRDCSITEMMAENLPYLKYERTFGAASKDQKD